MENSKLIKIINVCELITDMNNKHATTQEVTSVVNYLTALIDDEADELEAHKELLHIKEKYQPWINCRGED